MRNMSEIPKWDIEGAAQTLSTKPKDTYDALLGSGFALSFEKSETLKPSLELFPDRLIARYRDPLIQLSIAQVEAVSGEEGRIRVEGMIGKRRGVLYFNTQGPDIFNFTNNGEHTDPKGGSGEPIPSQPAKSEEVKPEVTNNEEKKEKQRVVFTGRVAADPDLKDTKTGGKYLQIAVSNGQKEDGKTRWETIKFWNQKAEEMAQRVAKGKMVTVIGYVHEEERKVGPNSNITKKVQVVYGSSIEEPKKSK